MGNVFAFVADSEYYKDHEDQIRRIQKAFPSIERDSIWGQGQKKFRSCRDIRNILETALRAGDTFIITHLFMIATRRDAILDTLVKFHEAKVQLVILDIGYQDRCAQNPPKIGSYLLYTRILREYARLKKQKCNQQGKDEWQQLTKNEKPRQKRAGHPEKSFTDYDPEVQKKVRFHVQAMGTLNEKTLKETLNEIQKIQPMSLATLKRVIKKYGDYLKQTHRLM